MSGKYSAFPYQPMSILCGRLTDAPVLRSTPDSGTSVMNLKIAVSRRYNAAKDGGTDWKEITQFYSAALWREAAERLNKRDLQKGDVVMVTYNPADLIGRIWVDSEGKSRASLEIKGNCQVHVIATTAVAQVADVEETAPEGEEVPL